MPKYLMILHDAMPVLASLSPAQMQAVIEKYQGWSAKIAESGKLAGGEKLKDEGGRHLTASSGKLVVRDGPFAEAKEVIGGYFIIESANYDDAVALSSDCPHLELGGRIELREIDVMG